jgi:hypothetical protein
MFSAFPFGNPEVWKLEQTDEYKQSQIPGELGQTGDAFGSAVAVGDVDGDGYYDMIVGVPGKTISGFVGAGEIAVFPRYKTGYVMAPTNPHNADWFGASLAIGNFDRGANSVVHNHQPDLAVGIPGRAAGGANDAGVFNTYKGWALTFWRQFDESTHDGP